MPKFECHHCTQHIDADDSLGGQSVACPNCGVTLTVPLPTASPRQEAARSPAPKTSPDAVGRMRNYAGVAALGALGISALCVTIPYASAGSEGMMLLTSDVLVGQSIGRSFVNIAVGAAVSAVIAGIAYALKKPFALNFYGTFIWVVLAVSLLGLSASIRKGEAIKRAVFKRNLDAMSKKAVSDAVSEMESATERVFSAADASKPSPSPTNPKAELSDEEVFSSPHSSKPSPSPTNPKAELSDGVAEVQAISTVIQELSSDAIRARKDYERALDEAGIGKLLDADRIAADANFTDTLAILMKVRSVVAENRRLSEKRMAGLPERFEKFNFSPSTKQRMADGLEKGFQKGLPLMREGLDLEDKVVELFEEVIDHLMTTKGRWKPAGGVFMFYEDQDLEKFTSLMQQIQSCVARQEEIQKESANQTAEKFQEMRDLLRKH